MNRSTRRVALAAALATGAVLVPAGSALAEQEPVLVEQHGSHAVWVSPSEPYDVEDHTTYWDLVSLDGMCGFTAPTLELSNMRETYFVQEKQRGAAEGSSTVLGKILDETFELTERTADGAPIRVYRGTGDEYAQAKHNADGSPDLVNLTVKFRGASDDGHTLAFDIQAKLRTDAQTGEFTRFAASVTSCHVR